MRAKLNRIRLRDVALFAVVAGVVAVVVVLAGREAGIGEQAGAGTEAAVLKAQAAAQEGDEDEAGSVEPLTLTLIAQEDICETQAAREMIFLGLRTNDRGQRVNHRISQGWSVRSETPVRWRVTGGAGPYRLMIDEESRDRLNVYEGPLGRALVGCADASVGTSFDDIGDGVQRLYDADPQVDSALKTIRGIVTDASGLTAETTIKVYVILSTGDSGTSLSAGETYRIYRHLLTIPDGVRASVGGYEEISCEGTDCEDSFGINLERDDFIAAMYFGAGSGREDRDARYIRLKDGASGASDAESRRQEIDRLLDQLSNSAGVKPTAEGSP